MLVCLLALAAACGGGRTAPAASDASRARLDKRWLFIWRDMADPKEVDRMIARFPRAHADGFNGVAFAYDIPADRSADLTRDSQARRSA